MEDKLLKKKYPSIERGKANNLCKMHLKERKG